MKPNKQEANMKGYIDQIGCHACQHVFRRDEYDSRYEYYCNNHDAGVRPRCMSVAMNEDFRGDSQDPNNDEKYENELRRWEKWAEERKVNPWGICAQIKIL